MSHAAPLCKSSSTERMASSVSQRTFWSFFVHGAGDNAIGTATGPGTKRALKSRPTSAGLPLARAGGR